MVEIDFFDFCVGTHHEVLAPERNREHSIGDQVAALNVGFMERLHYTGRVGALFDAQGRVDLNLFNTELTYQTNRPVELVRASKGSLLFTPKAGVKGQCSGLGRTV